MARTRGSAGSFWRPWRPSGAIPFRSRKSAGSSGSGGPRLQRENLSRQRRDDDTTGSACLQPACAEPRRHPGRAGRVPRRLGAGGRLGRYRSVQGSPPAHRVAVAQGFSERISADRGVMTTPPDQPASSPRARSPGGTPGGLGEFLGGLALVVAGGYLLLNQVTVTSGFWSFR